MSSFLFGYLLFGPSAFHAPQNSKKKKKNLTLTVLYLKFMSWQILLIGVEKIMSHLTLNGMVINADGELIARATFML